MAVPAAHEHQLTPGDVVCKSHLASDFFGGGTKEERACRHISAVAYRKASMTNKSPPRGSPLPSVDRILRDPSARRLIDRSGREMVADAIRSELTALRGEGAIAGIDDVLKRTETRLEHWLRPSLRRVFNLTGTVIHTNLGRATLPEEAIAAAGDAMRWPNNLEFDLERGGRGDRDDHLRPWLTRLTGAEDATVVNNNAAALVLVLSSLAMRRQVPVSRGELIEIGGSFRIPEIMARAGCRLVEVGTTNRTHLRDYEAAIGGRTALLLSVHASNYAIVGFTASPRHKEIAALARRHGLPYVVDLGSGSIAELEDYDLPHEPTPRELIAEGADIVTFSGDKLLGAPQAGIIAGREDLLRKINRNPLKRAFRMDKARIAALEVILRIYADPSRLAERLPTLSTLTRSADAIFAQAGRLEPIVRSKLGPRFSVERQPCSSQIGSGSLPVDRLSSFCLAIRSRAEPAGRSANRIAWALRQLPIPVIGRIEDGWVKLDLRGLDDEPAFLSSIDALAETTLP